MKDGLYSRRSVLKMLFGGLGAVGVAGATKLIVPDKKETAEKTDITLSITAKPSIKRGITNGY